MKIHPLDLVNLTSASPGLYALKYDYKTDTVDRQLIVRFGHIEKGYGTYPLHAETLDGEVFEIFERAIQTPDGKVRDYDEVYLTWFESADAWVAYMRAIIDEEAIKDVSLLLGAAQ